MLQMLIEAAAGSCEKNYYDEKTLVHLRTRRVARPYPYPYGFILGTHSEDGDGVDCYLITRQKLAAGATVACEPIGLLLQDEGGEIDHKILAVLPGETAVAGPELLQELQEFITAIFAPAPELQVRVGPLLPREAALRHLKEAGAG